MASSVLLEPVPAITGTRPRASAMHISMTALCSSGLSVGLSPVVPTGTSPCEPCSICQWTNFRNAGASTSPFFMGVMSAGKEPLNVTAGCSGNDLETIWVLGLQISVPQPARRAAP
jgi:hypothetical protein